MVRAPVTLTFLFLVAACADIPTATDLLGSWGGDHLLMQVDAVGASLEYDCASGTINEPIRPDAMGRFDVLGVHTPGQGGPVRQGEVGPSYAARYVGRVEGRRMTLTVSLVDTTAVVGTFDLEQGRSGSVWKCL